MLATKSQFPPASASASASSISSAGLAANTIQPGGPPPNARRIPNLAAANNPPQTYASPTDSDFSETDGPDSVRNWNQDRVCDYLVKVKCAEYEKLFRKHNINGENLLEMDKHVLKEMGIEKVGDRVRLFLCIKKLRTKACANQKKRHRDSFAALDPISSSAPGISPRLASLRTNSNSNTTASTPATRRYSRQIDVSALLDNDRSNRPASPSGDLRQMRQQRFQPATSYNTTTTTTTNPTSRTPLSSDGSASASRLPSSAHNRNNSSMDGSLMAALPQGQGVIRVISTGGVTKVVKIADCNTCEDVMRVTLRKFSLREDYERNYCFWVLTGLDPDPLQCRRLGDTELWRIIKDQRRPERNRLILRRVPAGEPGEAELQRAAAIALEEEQQKHTRALEAVDKRSQVKVQKLLGENWDDQLQQPLSPVFLHDRDRNLSAARRELERPSSTTTTTSETPSRPQRKVSVALRQFGGLRPPSELIASDLTSYFPDHPREDIDRTARLSMRRSTRLSRINSRLSVASSLSIASSVQDAPPIPTIADSWLHGNAHIAKVRGRDVRSAIFRDSISSSMLATLQEEESLSEPNRKSYVSYAESGTDTVNSSVPSEGTISGVMSYYGGGGGGGGGGSDGAEGSSVGGSSAPLQDIKQALTNDGEDDDEELQSFLDGDSWDDHKWMKGALIGQGSFGCVYLALHAVTGELLAVKQVETPSGTLSASDSRKKSMIDALKREIGLLRELRHPNIVQYLGCSSSTNNLNIFLEYVAGGSVQTMLNSYGALGEPLVRSFVRQILTGLSYLHEREIIHRDIKGANILVDNKGTIKISDFGISKKLEATTSLLGGAAGGGGAGKNAKNRPSMQGSVFWMAPEVVKQTSYTRKADIWSLGCLVVEMMTGTHPFPDCSQLQAIFKIGGGKAAPTIPENASMEGKAFLRRTFELDHDERPSADELMMSPFLNPMT